MKVFADQSCVQKKTCGFFSVAVRRHMGRNTGVLRMFWLFASNLGVLQSSRAVVEQQGRGQGNPPCGSQNRFSTTEETQNQASCGPFFLTFALPFSGFFCCPFSSCFPFSFLFHFCISPSGSFLFFLFFLLFFCQFIFIFIEKPRCFIICSVV